MKKFKIEFSLVLIPTLGMIMSALLVTMFLTTMNRAYAVSFPFSSPPLSPLQSQLQQQQQPLDTNGTMTRNPNEQ
jgi:hypothetical protein